MRDDILKVYQLLNKKYKKLQINRVTISDIRNSKLNVEIPKVMFPPLPDADFSAKCAEAGFLRHDCGIITAFRSEQDKNTNRNENEKLRKQIEVLGYKYREVIGWYKQAREVDASEEESYFVYDDGPENTSSFFEQLYLLSERFGQDSFLFKKAGPSRTAFLINTNDDSREYERKEAISEGRESSGDISDAGQLYLNLPLGIQKPATLTDKGRFTFRRVPPTKEELKYSQKYK